MIISLKLPKRFIILILIFFITLIFLIYLLQQLRKMQPNFHFNQSAILSMFIQFQVLRHYCEIFHGDGLFVNCFDILIVNRLESIEHVDYDEWTKNVCTNYIVSDEMLVHFLASHVVHNVIASAAKDKE